MTPPTSNVLWKTLMRHYEANRFACTYHTAMEFTATHPENPHGWLILGDALTWAARYDEALTAIKRAERELPQEEKYRAFQTIGHMYSEKGDLKRASTWYQKAIDHHPSTRTFIYLGGCLAVQGRHKEARECFETAIDLKTDVLDEAYYNLGMALRSQGEYEEALSCFEKAAKLDPHYAHAKSAADDLKTHLKSKKKLRKTSGRSGIGKKRK